MQRLSWNLFLAMQFAIAFSRVYNLNHFPHQCVCGLAAGALVLRLTYAREELWTGIVSQQRALSLAVAFFVVVPLTVYYAMMRAGIDPGETTN